jgi:hypothetical protein
MHKFVEEREESSTQSFEGMAKVIKIDGSAIFSQ